MEFSHARASESLQQAQSHALKSVLKLCSLLDLGQLLPGGVQASASATLKDMRRGINGKSSELVSELRNELLVFALQFFTVYSYATISTRLCTHL